MLLELNCCDCFCLLASIVLCSWKGESCCGHFTSWGIHSLPSIQSKLMIHLLSGFRSVLYTVIALSRLAAYIFSLQAPSWEDWWILKPSSSNWVPHRFEFLHSSSMSMFLSSTNYWYYPCLNFYADKFVELVVGVQTRYTYISGSWGGKSWHPRSVLLR